MVPQTLLCIGGNETLQMPILDFSLQTHFSKLEGQSIAGFGDDATIELAYLDVRLRLDETGAEFVSVAEFGGVGDFGDDEVVEYKPERIRRLILNKPYRIRIRLAVSLVTASNAEDCFLSEKPCAPPNVVNDARSTMLLLVSATESNIVPCGSRISTDPPGIESSPSM